MQGTRRPQRKSPPAGTPRRGPKLDLTRIPPGWAAGALLVAAAVVLALWILSMPGGEPEGTAPATPLAAPSPATAAPPPATAAPTSSAPALRVGGWAKVQGTEGQDLRLRAAPGLSSETLALVEEGTLLRILEGPAQADGYTWWRVQAPDDRSGWAAGQWLAPQ
ncbi:MAG: SH3 domain-containing protein [Anaerolineae bacterium]|nr:SH3 domain-containing protein [Anaerolineae bacterium]